MIVKIELTDVEIKAALRDYLSLKGLNANKVTLRATEDRSWNDQPTGTFSIAAFVETQ